VRKTKQFNQNLEEIGLSAASALADDFVRGFFAVPLAG